MVTVLRKETVSFADYDSGRKTEAIMEIETDNISEFPTANGNGIVEFDDCILHQGTVIHAIKDGVIAMLSGDGNWYDPSGEIVNISG